jgi:hypothetical protein
LQDSIKVVQKEKGQELMLVNGDNLLEGYCANIPANPRG